MLEPKRNRLMRQELIPRSGTEIPPLPRLQRPATTGPTATPTLIPPLPPDMPIRTHRPFARRPIRRIQVPKDPVPVTRILDRTFISDIRIPVDIPPIVGLVLELRPEVQWIVLRLDNLPSIQQIKIRRPFGIQ